MIERNSFFSNLTSGYLFPEINKRRRAFASENPDAGLISLGIGNTTEPLTPHIVDALAAQVARLGTKDGYSGYGDEAGLSTLRDKIAEVLYENRISPDEVFVSDGAKCDIGRIQYLFGSRVSVAVQDPAYPVYVDGSVMIGAASAMISGTTNYAGITYMPCTRENSFFPDTALIPENSLVYFCSPNNPTGEVATREQLTVLVKTAREKGSIIIFDSAYAAFIRDPSLPRSIFEIDGARECAIEVGSFSKPVGFTGVRLGWTIVPKELAFADGTPIIQDWNRLFSTIFNGASNIAQAGGLASLEPAGLVETRETIDYYLENARIIRDALQGPNFGRMGVEVYGGDNAPYVWVRFPGKKSWDIFDAILEKCHVVCTPGAGFGPAGESYIRFSSFGHRDDILEAAQRLSRLEL
jgi:LL-diaminopimelate aminotransferase